MSEICYVAGMHPEAAPLPLGPRSVPLGARPATRQKTRHGSKMFAMALHVDHIYVLFPAGCAINLEKKMLPAMTSGAIYEALGAARQPHPAGSQGAQNPGSWDMSGFPPAR